MPECSKDDSESQWEMENLTLCGKITPTRSSQNLSWMITPGTSTNVQNLVPIGLGVFASNMCEIAHQGDSATFFINAKNLSVYNAFKG